MVSHAAGTSLCLIDGKQLSKVKGHSLFLHSSPRLVVAGGTGKVVKLHLHLDQHTG